MLMRYCCNFRRWYSRVLFDYDVEKGKDEANEYGLCDHESFKLAPEVFYVVIKYSSSDRKRKCGSKGHC